MSTMYKELNIKKVKNGILFDEQDFVVKEYPLTILINGKEFITLLASPNHLKYLAIGFLKSEGLIRDKGDINNIKIRQKEGIVKLEIRESLLTEKLHGKRMRTTGCGRGTVFYSVLDSLRTKKVSTDVKVTADFVNDMMKELNKRSQTFLKTGGVHSCMLCDHKEVILFHEDIGRHNAIDKIIGEALMKDIPLNDKIIFTSGRVSSEILLKSAKSQIPMIVSRSAPTDLAVAMAKKLGITLVGFVRGRKMNVYTNFENIIIA